MFVRNLQKEESKAQQASDQAVGSTTSRGKKETMWEYRFAMDQDAVYGPFPTSQMLEWFEKKYFTPDTVLFVRRVPADDDIFDEESKFVPAQSINFKHYK